MAGLSKRKYDIQFYVKVVEKFVQTGECAKTLYGETEDPLLLYLLAEVHLYSQLREEWVMKKMLTPL